ncbi:septal ring lytic transglycosylase RlpA family protein [Lysobacter yangpyeongensis]|uniref:Endolytic peptidoglycan transglycosylase RlpA n=1 Tax=Lysobacter yangpyeongensis TaxID=346182 RepID=A0ABW0SN94_9GAMM
MRAWLGIALMLGLAACAGAPKKSAPPAAAGAKSQGHDGTATTTARRKSPYAPAQEDPAKRGDYVAGGLYAPGVRDSVPDDIPDVDAIPEPEVTDEPRSPVGNRKVYSVLGKKYEVLDDAEGYVETGIASFYGRKFHGRRTSNLEVYDMYAFSAAHKTLPLPSFARVTNLDNGKSVIVRINDRGPFHAGRLIDLSYAAATKLGYVSKGTARVEVRALTPRDVAHAAPPQARDPEPSAIDRLVAAMPVATAAAADMPGPRSGAAEQRFDMRQDGRTMTAAEFDAWMKSRQLRIATGRPGNASADAANAATTPPPAAASTPTGSAPVPPTPAGAEDGRVFLQVASFAARANADRALAVLQGAGIAAAALSDGDAHGRKVWRLRVGPLAAAAAPELAARIVGLGFGTPQRVRE